MKESTRLLLEIIKNCEERDGYYSINDHVLYLILGNQEFEMHTSETAKLRDVLDLIENW